MYDFQKHFEPDFSSILIKSYFIFPIALILFTYGFTEIDKDAYPSCELSIYFAGECSQI